MQRPGADREPIQSAARIVLVSASSVPSPWPDLGGTERIDRLSKSLSCQKISRKLGAADVLLAFGHPKCTCYGEKPNYFKQIRSCRGPSGFWTPKNYVLWRETKTIMKTGAVRCQTTIFFFGLCSFRSTFLRSIPPHSCHYQKMMGAALTEQKVSLTVPTAAENAAPARSQHHGP